VCPCDLLKKISSYFREKSIFRNIDHQKNPIFENRRNFLSVIYKIHMKKPLPQAIQNYDRERGLHSLNQDKSNFVNTSYQKNDI